MKLEKSPLYVNWFYEPLFITSNCFFKTVVFVRENIYKFFILLLCFGMLLQYAKKNMKIKIKRKLQNG